MKYNDSITQIKGIGEKTAKLLNKLDVFTIGDLIELYPREYDAFKPIIPIASAIEGQTVTIEGFINNAPKISSAKGLNIISLMFKDSSGSIQLCWYNMPFLKSTLRVGNSMIVRGKVVIKKGVYRIEQPEIVTKENYYKTLNKMNPIYPLTKGLSNKVVTKAVEQALKSIEEEKDYLESKQRKEYDLIEYKKAIKLIHFPNNREEMLMARKRIVFDEFFVFSMALKLLKSNDSVDVSSFSIVDNGECDELINGLGYSLTGAQLRAFNEIKTDLLSGRCMNRLVQGDVGSGKTIIAALSLLLVAKNNYQGLLMVPTEVLAKQHYESLASLFEKFNIRTTLLTGSMTAKEKRERYALIKNHEVDVIIGTHALIQEKVEYDNVALVITDEQHRFGVKQRENLSLKGNRPHMLVMSATPIPRTMAIILYGDLDISVIDEMPKGRLQIKNCVVSPEYRPTAYEFCKKEIMSGRQVYVICPMAEPNENIEAENVVDYSEKLKQIFPPDFKVEYIYGKMRQTKKDEIMEKFVSGDINVLVSTTVIEVGVNVPNSTVMLIENAERFGLAQLHQLRGRVGRGQYQSYCIMINTTQTKTIQERLNILNTSNDGFYIASKDLELRGPGELFGTIQSGELIFKLGDIYNDSESLKIATQLSKEWKYEEFLEKTRENYRILENVSRYTGNTIL